MKRRNKIDVLYIFIINLMNKIFTIVVIVALAACVHGQDQGAPEAASESKYEIQDNVLILTSENAQDAIDQFPLIIIKFFAPWCGHCKQLAPTWKDIGRTMSLDEDVGKNEDIQFRWHRLIVQFTDSSVRNME